MWLCIPDPQSLDSYQNQTFTEDAKTTRAYLIAHSSVGLPIGGVKLVQKKSIGPPSRGGLELEVERWSVIMLIGLTAA